MLTEGKLETAPLEEDGLTPEQIQERDLADAVEAIFDGKDLTAANVGKILGMVMFRLGYKCASRDIIQPPVLVIDNVIPVDIEDEVDAEVKRLEAEAAEVLGSKKTEYIN